MGTRTWPVQMTAMSTRTMKESQSAVEALLVVPPSCSTRINSARHSDTRKKSADAMTLTQTLKAGVGTHTPITTDRVAGEPLEDVPWREAAVQRVASGIVSMTPSASRTLIMRHSPTSRPEDDQQHQTGVGPPLESKPWSIAVVTVTASSMCTVTAVLAAGSLLRRPLWLLRLVAAPGSVAACTRRPRPRAGSHRGGVTPHRWA